ncbi:hypothetical protein CEXT_29771 [Caerostris extrusa]|uniref:Uncharacterized protein n=1 Tax=Caerostris extrusa TaxID=172846 RepID=A0AAV4U5S7_CAEEX|nr:hypothetical protein CEXT_29771 [Caerostris extrusa]
MSSGRFVLSAGVEGCLECVSVLTSHDEVLSGRGDDKGTRKIVWSCVAFCIVGLCCLFRDCLFLINLVSQQNLLLLYAKEMCRYLLL